MTAKTRKEKILFEGKTKIAMCNGKIHFERDWYGRDHEYSNCTCGSKDEAQNSVDAFADYECNRQGVDA